MVLPPGEQHAWPCRRSASSDCFLVVHVVLVCTIAWYYYRLPAWLGVPARRQQVLPCRVRAGELEHGKATLL